MFVVKNNSNVYLWNNNLDEVNKQGAANTLSCLLSELEFYIVPSELDGWRTEVYKDLVPAIENNNVVIKKLLGSSETGEVTVVETIVLVKE